MVAQTEHIEPRRNADGLYRERRETDRAQLARVAHAVKSRSRCRGGGRRRRRSAGNPGEASDRVEIDISDVRRSAACNTELEQRCSGPDIAIGPIKVGPVWQI